MIAENYNESRQHSCIQKCLKAFESKYYVMGSLQFIRRITMSDQISDSNMNLVNTLVAADLDYDEELDNSDHLDAKIYTHRDHLSVTDPKRRVKNNKIIPIPDGSRPQSKKSEISKAVISKHKMRENGGESVSHKSKASPILSQSKRILSSKAGKVSQSHLKRNKTVNRGRRERDEEQPLKSKNYSRNSKTVNSRGVSQGGTGNNSRIASTNGVKLIGTAVQPTFGIRKSKEGKGGRAEQRGEKSYAEIPFRDRHGNIEDKMKLYDLEQP